MKKMVSSLVMASALLLGSIAPVVANAAGTDTETRSASTKTTASFTEDDTTTTTPVDPTDPTKPLEPDTGNTVDPDGKTGGLSLIYAPKTIDFGTHAVNTVETGTFSAADKNGKDGTEANTTDLMGSSDKVGLQVSDKRGTNAGWTLTASTNDGDGGNISSLKGATITLPVGSAYSSGSSEAYDASKSVAENGATSVSATLAAGNGAAATVFSAAGDGTTTDTDGNVTQGTATTTGAGISSVLMDPSKVTLTVPANVAKAITYTGAINWTLSSTADK